jgi:O-antigen ligase
MRVFLPISLLLASAFFYFKTPKKEVLFRPFLILSSLFFIYILSFAFSSNLTYGLKKIETSLSLIVVPMCYFLLLRKYPFDFDIVKRNFQKVFFTANVVYGALAGYLIQFYRSPKFLFTDASFIRSAISDIPLIGEHPTYVSIFFSLALMCGFSLATDLKNRLSKLLVVLGMLFITGILLAIMSKGIIIALIASIFPIWLLRLKGNSKIWILVGLTIVLAIILSIPRQNNRFYELVDKQSFEKTDINNSTSVRFHIFKASIQLIKESPVFGYGIGDVQDELDAKYSSMGLNLPKSKFNSHNQFLFICLNSGLMGLLIFLFSIAYVFKTALLKRDYFFLGILVFFLVAFLFENVLSRQSGVILFSFLINSHMLHDTAKLNELKNAKADFVKLE